MKPKKIKKRNPIIFSAFKNEIDLKTKVQKDKKQYSRKDFKKLKYSQDYIS